MPTLLYTSIQKKVHLSGGDSLANQRTTLSCTVVVVNIRNYRKIVLFFVADDGNEYQMTRASKKSIELQTAYVYRKNTPRRHHYSGGGTKVAVINVCSLANAYSVFNPRKNSLSPRPTPPPHAHNTHS